MGGCEVEAKLTRWGISVAVGAVWAVRRRIRAEGDRPGIGAVTRPTISLLFRSTPFYAVSPISRESIHELFISQPITINKWQHNKKKGMTGKVELLFCF